MHVLRKIGIVTFILVFTIGLIGCGGGETAVTPDAAEDSPVPVSTTASNDSTLPSFDDEPSGTVATSSIDDNTGITQSDSLDMNASLPSNYPHDVLPIYPGSTVSQVMEVAGSFTVVAHTNTPYSDVISFYDIVLKNANKFSETVEDTALTSYGQKDGYVYNIDISKCDDYEDFSTQIWVVQLSPLP